MLDSRRTRRLFTLIATDPPPSPLTCPPLPFLCARQSFFLLRLHVAQELRDAPRLFFPHNLDFRGRAYPMHPYLHHMGDDVSRGLLTFADGKPLGQHGLAWLFTHVSHPCQSLVFVGNVQGSSDVQAA